MEQPLSSMIIPGLQEATMNACEDLNWAPVRNLLQKSLKKDSIANKQLTSIEKGGNIMVECCNKGYVSLISLFLANGFPITYRIKRKTSSDHSKMLNLATRGRQLCLVEYLLSNGADINDHDGKGYTPLHCAAELGYTEIVEFLLWKGADINKYNEYQETPLHLSVNNQHLSVVKLLLKAGCNIDKKHHSDLNALCYAVLNENFECVKLLIEFGANVNASYVLHSAAMRNNIAIMDLLFQSGATPDQRSMFSGETPLHRAVAYKSLGAVKCLVEHGANVNLRCKSNCAPLFAAIHDLDVNCDIVQLLLSGGADVSTLYSDNDTILHKAVKMRRSQPIIELLLEGGVSVNAKNDSNVTALYIHAFLNYPIDNTIGSQNVSEDVINTVGTSVIWGADINISDNNGHTLLHWAAWKGNVHLVKLLIEQGIDVNIKNRFGKKAIHLAVDAGRHDVIQYLIDILSEKYS